MGHEYIEMKNTAAAIEAYRRAVDVNGRDYRAWYGLGQTYEILNMYFYALYYYRKAAVLRPRDARMWIAIAQCYEKLNRDDDAIKGYERAAQHDDQEGHALLKLARLHRGRASHDEAFACYSHYARLHADTDAADLGDATAEARYPFPRRRTKRREVRRGPDLFRASCWTTRGPRLEAGDAARDPGARRPGVVRAGGRHGALYGIMPRGKHRRVDGVGAGTTRARGRRRRERTSRALWTQALSLAVPAGIRAFLRGVPEPPIPYP